MSAKVMDFKPRDFNTRQATYAVCRACEYQWVAPTIGKCPRCGGDQTQRLAPRHFEYPRIR